MSWIQAIEEEQYDTQTEYLNVLRAEAIDHFEVEFYCEEHDLVHYDGCEFCPEEPEDTERFYIPEYDMPF